VLFDTQILCQKAAFKLQAIYDACSLLFTTIPQEINSAANSSCGLIALVCSEKNSVVYENNNKRLEVGEVGKKYGGGACLTCGAAVKDVMVLRVYSGKM
jgi:hypothetical protein